MTAPYFTAGGVTAYLGDCLDVLRTLPDASVDAVVCDPPYALAELSTAVVLDALAAWMRGDRDYVPAGKGFMGRAWDRFVPPPGAWDECMRVLKPGGHLLAFAAPRTVDLMGLSIRIAGFEVRDSLHWMYGSGFPKSLDVGKAIDRRRNDLPDILKVTAFVRDARKRAGVTIAAIDAEFGTNGMAWRWSTTKESPVVPTWDQWTRLKNLICFGDEMDAEVWRLNGRKGTPGEAWNQREVIGQRATGIGTGQGSVPYIGDSDNRDVTAPATAEAVRWGGWGTALKPAHEPIVVARRPLAGTVAGNVLQHGTGALNIDACRTAAGQDYRDKRASVVGLDSNRNGDAYGEWAGARTDSAHHAGRWPTNVVMTHQPLIVDGEVVGDACADGCVDGCPVAELDRQSGVTTSSGGKGEASRRTKSKDVYSRYANDGTWASAGGLGDSGGASRFFPTFRYEAKAPAYERPRLADGTAWPTVKPLSLMRWLIRLVTPPGGTVLDPFAGSGATGEAAVIEGFRCLLIDQDPVAAELIKVRLGRPISPVLDFGEEIA